MYDKMKMLIKNKTKSQFLTPGESFIISNKHWFEIKNNTIKPEQAEIITDKKNLLIEYEEYIIIFNIIIL